MDLIPGRMYLGKNGIQYIYIGTGLIYAQDVDKNGVRTPSRLQGNRTPRYIYAQKKRVEAQIKKGLLSSNLREVHRPLGISFFQIRETPIRMEEDCGEYLKPEEMRDFSVYEHNPQYGDAEYSLKP